MGGKSYELNFILNLSSKIVFAFDIYCYSKTQANAQMYKKK